MKNGTEKYIETIQYLGKLYDKINENLFDGELEKPVITVQADEKNKSLGWWTVNKVWQEKTGEGGDHELNISAQFLNRPVNQIAATLLHEMCHQYAAINNLQDCSRGGTYHNKLFKKIAETHGLRVDRGKTIGWSYTELAEDTAQLILDFIAQNPDNMIYRLPVVTGQCLKTPNTRKYYCPICGLSVRATKQVNIICADCYEPMTEEEIAMKDTIRAHDFYHVHYRINEKGLPIGEIFDGDMFLFEAERRFFLDFVDDKDYNEYFLFYEIFTTRKGNQFVYWGDKKLNAEYISLIE